MTAGEKAGDSTTELPVFSAVDKIGAMMVIFKGKELGLDQSEFLCNGTSTAKGHWRLNAVEKSLSADSLKKVRTSLDQKGSWFATWNFGKSIFSWMDQQRYVS